MDASTADLVVLVEGWQDRRVLVVGDGLLDGWRSGRPSRLCREAPVPVVDLDREGYACGGAANTAANLAALGARVTFVGAVGDDASGRLLRERLSEAVRLLRVPGRGVPSARTAGAGDSYVAAFALARTCGVDCTRAAAVAARAAQVAVAREGTALCSAADLIADAGAAPRIVDAVTLSALVDGYRSRGMRLVFTNGCFDVLHRGHVGYLEEARALGDVLIVALNSDGSVRRLKGPDRPVNAQDDRAAVLAALSSVDLVVIFDEDSPRRLLALVRPDVYVKGGDYPPELIPEADLVRELGGEVRALEYLPDVSTSRIIERIRTA